MTHLNLGDVFFFIWTKKENGKSKLIESFITFSNSFIEEVFHTQRETERESENKLEILEFHTQTPPLSSQALEKTERPPLILLPFSYLSFTPSSFRIFPHTVINVIVFVIVVVVSATERHFMSFL